MLSIVTAAWAAPVFPVHRSALLGQSLTWRPAGAGLLANAIRVRRNCCSRPHPAAAAAAPHTH